MFNFLIILLLIFLQFYQANLQFVTIQLINNCNEEIWPAFKNDDKIIKNGGFGPMMPGETQNISVPQNLKASRIWPRTGCGSNINCSTGSCGVGILECNGLEGQIPASLAEFTLDGDQSLSYYDVSYVDGFNIPLQIKPIPGTFNTTIGKCLNVECIEDQRKLNLTNYNIEIKDNNGNIIAIKSLCSKYNTDQTCCRNNFNNGETCKKSWDATQINIYNEIKNICPNSYLYAYDDHTSLFTCKGNGERITPDFQVIFCGLKV